LRRSLVLIGIPRGHWGHNETVSYFHASDLDRTEEPV
jgi:hypothetical protein